MSTTDGTRLLIVDDEEPLVRALCATLEQEGYSITGHTSARKALSSIQCNAYDLLITDLMMPEMDGMDLLQAAWRIDADIAGVVMTGHGTIATAVKAMQLGALDYMQKPFDLDVVRAVIKRALQIRQLRVENARLTARDRQHLIALEAAYQDLDAFSVSISHDLRAPLRAIAGFTGAYLADHGGSLTESGRRQLDLVLKSGARMDRMIEDLLRFCRCSRQALQKRCIDTTALVNGVLEDVKARFTPHLPAISMSALPSCEADRTLLEQVFVNLLSNAFKFTQGVAEPRIEIGAVSSECETTFSVKDNGKGFDMQYAPRLFGVFQRLHSAHEFEGTGVGLSIVKRIVERHGGRVWAESAPGAGATFYFTLAIRGPG